MSEKQPDALRLAEAMEQRVIPRWVHATGETPRQYGFAPDAECQAAATELRRLYAECEALRFTRALAQARYENAVKLLTGIHELLYPAPVNTPDGRTLVFRPDDPDPHAILQLLGERIRAIPEELEAAHSSAWWTYRTEPKRQRDAARAAKEQSK